MNGRKFWDIPAGARQATRLRRRYLQAVLRQEAAFFDASAKSGALLQGLNEDTSAIQLAIGEKVSHQVPKCGNWEYVLNLSHAGCCLGVLGVKQLAIAAHLGVLQSTEVLKCMLHAVFDRGAEHLYW